MADHVLLNLNNLKQLHPWTGIQCYTNLHLPSRSPKCVKGQRPSFLNPGK